ncbi:uncharacterized protein JN550_010030 [Neoarthrinium moseri]|uniref:uncharacterized protein n=1 Tax=Neoarthrinium moseri TaxID=1658444 RepID=UPI001FDC28D2|nr:uncharacterized protein JN550_010030 [Neoarthrinium moseri]KAI1862693.1 hypothetical protein JN550_010030 [Neoarthrinium moseri]
MATETAEQMQAKVLKSLEGTRYAAASLERLSGGVGNFLYRAQLVTPLDDGTAEVVVKHGEGYIARSPENSLTLDRCKVEEECLKALSSFRVTGQQDSVKYVVRTPHCYFYDEKSNSQILEYLPNGIDLKNYALKNFAAPSPDSLKPQCHELGRELAQWLVGFHRQSEQEARAAREKGGKSALFAQLEPCREMQQLKHMINYDWMVQRIAKFPDVLAEAREVFEEFKAAALDELKGELMPIHGDFWTGNIVLANIAVEEGAEIPLFVIDWEMAQLGVRELDYGQMLAEMYQLWLYKNIDAGLWMVQGFAEGLQLQSERVAFRTAAQLGCHLVAFGCVTPGWGTPEQGREVARVGRDVIVNARNGNREWFEKSELACLFSHVR